MPEKARRILLTIGIVLSLISIFLSLGNIDF
jgi:hypothetical protein